jgi:hypothetical protein
MANHPELLNISFEELMDKFDQKVSDIDEFMDTLDTSGAGAVGYIRGRAIVIDCNEYRKVVARLKTKYKTLNQSRIKRYKQKIGELEAKIKQTKQEKEEGEETHCEAMKTMDN